MGGRFSFNVVEVDYILNYTDSITLSMRDSIYLLNPLYMSCTCVNQVDELVTEVERTEYRVLVGKLMYLRTSLVPLVSF